MIKMKLKMNKIVKELNINNGNIKFENVEFNYNQK